MREGSTGKKELTERSIFRLENHNKFLSSTIYLAQAAAYTKEASRYIKPYNASTLVSSYFTKSYSIPNIGFLSCLRMRCIVIFSIYHEILQLEYSAKKKFTRNKNTDIRDPSHNRYAMNNAFDLRSARAILGDKK